MALKMGAARYFGGLHFWAGAIMESSRWACKIPAVEGNAGLCAGEIQKVGQPSTLSYGGNNCYQQFWPALDLNFSLASIRVGGENFHKSGERRSRDRLPPCRRVHAQPFVRVSEILETPG